MPGSAQAVRAYCKARHRLRTHGQWKPVLHIAISSADAAIMDVLYARKEASSRLSSARYCSARAHQQCATSDTMVALRRSYVGMDGRGGQFRWQAAATHVGHLVSGTVCLHRLGKAPEKLPRGCDGAVEVQAVEHYHLLRNHLQTGKRRVTLMSLRAACPRVARPHSVVCL